MRKDRKIERERKRERKREGERHRNRKKDLEQTRLVGEKFLKEGGGGRETSFYLYFSYFYFCFTTPHLSTSLFFLSSLSFYLFLFSPQLFRVCDRRAS